MPDRSRDPCPYVILHETGAGFVIGAIGGGILHGIKGARHSPKGLRLEGATHAIKARSPATAGNFAAWTGLMSAFDCAIVSCRQKHDIWNGIFSGAGADADTKRVYPQGGPRVAFAAAVIGGVVMGVFEGTFAIFERCLAENNRPQQPPIPQISTS